MELMKTWALRIGIIVVICAIPLGLEWFGKRGGDLWIVNTSVEKGVSIFVDGKKVVDLVPRTEIEDKNTTRKVCLKIGAHQIQARDTAGITIDSARVEVGHGSHGFLFSPKHSRAFRFVLQTSGYGSWSGNKGIEELDSRQSFWEMPKLIDRWFEESPSVLTVQKGTRGTFDRAVRMQKVFDPEKLGPLFSTALKGEDTRTRIHAALTAVEFGDIRAVPILVQFLDYNVPSAELSEEKGRAKDALIKFWKKEREYVNEMVLIEFWKQKGGLDAPEYKDVPSREIEELKKFLAEGRNLKNEAFEKACMDTRKAATADQRIRAMETIRLRRQPADESRVIEIFIECLRKGETREERHAAAMYLHRYINVEPGSKPDPRIEPVMIEQLKVEQDSWVLNDLFTGLSWLKSKAAIPCLLPFLDDKEKRVSVSSALQGITEMEEPGSRSRQDWETALRNANLLDPAPASNFMPPSTPAQKPPQPVTP